MSLEEHIAVVVHGGNCNSRLAQQRMRVSPPPNSRTDPTRPLGPPCGSRPDRRSRADATDPSCADRAVAPAGHLAASGYRWERQAQQSRLQFSRLLAEAREPVGGGEFDPVILWRIVRGSEVDGAIRPPITYTRSRPWAPLPRSPGACCRMPKEFRLRSSKRSRPASAGPYPR
jgi:hypothetical protein